MIIKPSLRRQRAVSLVVVFILMSTFVVMPVGVPASASLESQSYIVQGASVDLVVKLVEEYGGTVTSRLDIVNGVGAILPIEAVDHLLTEPGITAITPNARVELSGKKSGGGIPETNYPDVVGADLVWEEGVNGAGVTVAVVDTGLGLHRGVFKGIDGRVKGRILGWKDFVDNRHKPQDPNGHGTHIAGIIANSQIGEDGEWNGVAPGVSLVGVRVLDKEGFGTYEHVIQGIQWVLESKDELNIRVMNLSLVSAVQSPYWADPLNQAVMHAWAQGITVVVAAGNSGPDPMTIGVPGNNPYVITVGAFTDNYTPDDWSDDYIAPFSAAGPTLDGFVKPDVVAPGAHMVSSMSSRTYLARKHEANQVAKQYFSMAGTSQAAAVVSGIAALTLSENHDLTPSQVKFRIMFTALPWINLTSTEALYSMWQQGAGRVNAPDAVFGGNDGEDEEDGEDGEDEEDEEEDIQGEANLGMDIWTDLAGDQHYEGFSYYDEAAGRFRLHGEFNAWEGGYGAWSGGYGAWSGGYGAWSGGYGAWSGGYGAWSGGYGAWSGGYGAWSGGYGAWSGSEPWIGSNIADADFVSEFVLGLSPDRSSSITSITEWVEEP